MSQPQPRKNPRGADNVQGSLTDLAWLAGLIDGEGWLGLWRARRTGRDYYRYTAGIMVATTSDRIHEKAVQVLTDMDVHFYQRIWQPYEGADKIRRRRKFEFSVRSNTDTRSVLNAVLPYLTEKRVIAELAVAYIEWRQALPMRPGGSSKNFVPKMREHAEEVMRLCREDRNRHNPSTTTRLASSPKPISSRYATPMMKDFIRDLRAGLTKT